MSSIKLENLEINGYMIYQDKDSFNFGIDAVLLANFALRESSGARIARPYDSDLQVSPLNCTYEHNAEVPPNRTHERNAEVLPHRTRELYERNAETPLQVCDFCTGSLPIPLIMYAKRKMFFGENVKFTAFEIDKDQVELCKKSILYNKENAMNTENIDSDITVFDEDIKNIFMNRDKYKTMYDSFDIITVNPPYTKKGSGIVNTNDKKVAARHEIFITFDELCKVANLLLKSKKKFYIIHHSGRITEISKILKKNSFEIKKLQFIYPYVDKESNLVLIEAVKDANEGVKVLEPIIVYEKEGIYTKKILKIYGK